MEAIFELGTPFSRTLLCQKCFDAGRPKTTTAYVVYAGARRQLIIKSMSGYFRKITEASPHTSSIRRRIGARAIPSTARVRSSAASLAAASKRSLMRVGTFGDLR